MVRRRSPSGADPASGLGWWSPVLVGDGDGLEVTVGRDATAVETYIALPGTSNPKTMVSAKSDAGLRQTMTRTLSSRSVTLPKGAYQLLSASSRLLPQVSIVRRSDSSAPTLREHLGSLLGRSDIEITIASGPVRPNRKPVIRILDTEGSLLAFAKLGPDDETDRLVTNEARALAHLVENPVDRVRVPSVFAFDAWGGRPLLVLEPLPVDDTEVNTDVARVDADVAKRIATSFGTRRSPIGSLESLDELRRRLERLADNRPVSQTLERLANGPEVVVGAWHGDWSPFNMAPADGHSWFVWDWERFGDGVPLGLDLIHLARTYEQPGQRNLPSDIDERLAGIGADPAHREFLDDWYLLEVIARLDPARSWQALGERQLAMIALLAERQHRATASGPRSTP